MSGGAGSGYDYNAITFSPDGRLFQVEYANKSVDMDSLAIGVKCKDGILFATEKIKQSSLLMPGANPRIYWINENIACSTIGHRPDCYAAVNLARQEAERYQDNFGVAITVPELVSRVATYFHAYHIYSGYRPFGCTAIFASNVDKALYALEPSGQYYGYFACCFGKGSNLARADLQKVDWSELTVAEAMPKVHEILLNIHENGNRAQWEIEWMWICEDSNDQPAQPPAELCEQYQAKAPQE